MVNIFLLCFNESRILPQTIAHYRKYIPSCKITIYDNESTDNSVEIAKSLNCNVIVWSSNNINDEQKKINIRNACWKNIKTGWIIMADMDEWICISEKELNNERKKGTSILKIKGLDMVGESNSIDLSDINLHSINKYIENKEESKNICFLRDKIKMMNFGPGSHTCKPIGNIKYSSKIYFNKHMSSLGLPFLIDKMINRYKRSALNRSKGWSIHYTNDIEKIKKNYNKYLTNSKVLEKCAFIEGNNIIQNNIDSEIILDEIKIDEIKIDENNDGSINQKKNM